MTKSDMNKKIAFLVPDLVMGGVTKILLYLLDELHTRYPDLKLDVWTLDSRIETYFVDFFEKRNIALHISALPQKPDVLLKKIKYKICNPIRKTFRKWWLRNSISHQHYDILVDFHHFTFASYIKKIKVPKVAWIHISFPAFMADNKHALKYIKYYNKIVCLSKSFETDFKNEYPGYADKIMCIYNFIDKNKIINNANLPNHNGKYFCIVSRLDNDKDVATVITAFKIFQKGAPDAKLLVVGTGEQDKTLRLMAKGYPNINFVGKINEPYSIIKNAVANILSSYNEGFAMTLIESAVLGTLAISSNCKSGPSEILMNGNAGILFEPGNAYELAQIMDKVWFNKIDINKLITTATQNLERFSAHNNVKQIIDMFGKLYFEPAYSA